MIERAGRVEVDIRPLGRDDAAALTDFFRALVQSRDDRSFHPHPLTRNFAAFLAHEYSGLDIYTVAVENGRILGYGILRGWDEGYPIPSLGVAVHPMARRRGIAKMVMAALRESASARGAHLIRLRVHPNNSPAIALYSELGYKFDGRERGMLVGTLRLASVNKPTRNA